MKISSLILILLIINNSCSNKKNDNRNRRDSINRISPRIDSSKSKSSNLPDFLEISKQSKEDYMGYLQGVKNSDSSGPYVIREFISDTLSFDLIFFPKNLDKNSVDFEAIDKAAANNYHDYDCFVFVYPMKYVEPTDKNYHSDNTPYPVTIKSYLKKGNTWSLISEEKAKNLAELSSYKIRTMYHNIP